MDMIRHESKFLLCKEWSCLGWTRFKIIQFIVVTVSVLTPLVYVLNRLNFSTNFADKLIIMADCISRKDMSKKRFKLSTEVRATLQHKHDSWTPYRAYSRVEKELGVFQALMKIILSFFQMPPTTDEGEVGCNRRAVKMFTDLIKRSLRDDDFVSCKCTTFNVVLFFTIVLFAFFLMV